MSYIGDRNVLVVHAIGRTRHMTPDGFLLCEDVRIASTKPLLYRADEMRNVTPDKGMVLMQRPPEVLFSNDTLLSFNGKPITNSHPSTLVSPRTWKKDTVGIVLNPRRGTGDNDGYLVADLLITDEDSIRDVENGKCEVSCGYDQEHAEIKPGLGKFTRITGNHVALVEKGRCGPQCAIGDKGEEGEHWITIHPFGPDTKGQHVLINAKGTIKGGLGGKYTGRHISEVHGNPGRANSRTSAHAAFGGEAKEPYEGYLEEFREEEPGVFTSPSLTKKELASMRREYGMAKQTSPKQQHASEHRKKMNEVKAAFGVKEYPELNDPVEFGKGKKPIVYTSKGELPSHVHKMLREYGFVPPANTRLAKKLETQMKDNAMNKSIFNRLRSAFRSHDELAFDTELESVEAAMDNEPQRVVIELPGAAPEGAKTPAKDEDPLAKFAASLDAINARLDAMDAKFEKKEEKKEEEKHESCDEDKVADEAKKAADVDAALDAMSLATLRLDFQDVVSRAEILAPGIKVPTFDATATSKKTIADQMCGLRKSALDAASKNHAATIIRVIGNDGDIEKMTCDQLTIAFNAASELVRMQNNAPKPSFDHMNFRQGPMTAARMQELNVAARKRA